MEPIDMVLFCPACGMQHVDAPDRVEDMPLGNGPHALTVRARWINPPHRSHLCHGCGHIWRPADVPTNGVLAVQTKGKADSPVALAAPAGEPACWYCSAAQGEECQKPFADVPCRRDADVRDAARYRFLRNEPRAHSVYSLSIDAEDEALIDEALSTLTPER